jgi:hypothetical protein
MRLNVYAEEIPSDINFADPVAELLTKQARNGTTYEAVRMFLHSSDRLHQTPMDDDRSAITFWLPDSIERREFMAATFERLAAMIRHTTETTHD